MRFRYVNAVAATPEALWATGGVENDRVRRLEPPGEAVRLGTLGAIHGLGGLVANGNVLWIGSLDGTLWRIDPATGRVTTSAPLRRRIADAALGEGDLWLVTVDRSLLRVDSTSGRLTGQIQLGVFPTSRPHAIAAAGGSVWIAAVER